MLSSAGVPAGILRPQLEPTSELNDGPQIAPTRVPLASRRLLRPKNPPQASHTGGLHKPTKPVDPNSQSADDPSFAKRQRSQEPAIRQRYLNRVYNPSGGRTVEPTTQAQKIPRRKRSPPPRPPRSRHPENRACNPRQAQETAQAQKESAQRSAGLKFGRFRRNLVSRSSTRLIIRHNITRLE
jgi:hypothetical protein